jgi:hypothetical protein
MAIYSVITGDIVHSSKLSDAKRKLLLKQMKQLFEELTTCDTNLKIDIFRGDSFQAIQGNVELALLTALKIKTGLKRSDLLPSGIDAKMAIGIGEITLFSRKIQESDGEAFQNSGRLLDKLKNSEQTLVFRSPWDEINEEMMVHCCSLDAITHKWSSLMAEVVYELLNGSKQVQIAAKLGIKQPSVNQRIKLSNWLTVEKIIRRFEKIVKPKI